MWIIWRELLLCMGMCKSCVVFVVPVRKYDVGLCDEDYCWDFRSFV